MKNNMLWEVSEVMISYRTNPMLLEKPKITSSKDAETIFRNNWSDDMELYEECLVLFLTKANEVKGLFRASRGGHSGTVVDIKIVFATALKAMAGGIILAHNHPSGNLTPSKADTELTKKLRDVGLILDLPFLDHIILAPHQGYYSFADDGLI